MDFTPATVAVLSRLNQANLPDLCTVEHATKVPTATGGHTEQWLPVSDALTDLPCRVSTFGPANEQGAGGAVRRAAEYVVVLDGFDPNVRDIRLSHRLQVRSGDQPATGVAFAMTLYVLAADGPASLDPFPKVTCTTVPQPGQ